MSTAFNRRRGAKANQPRVVRTCHVIVNASTRFDRETNEWEGGVTLCNAAVSPSVNGNRCEEHRDA